MTFSPNNNNNNNTSASSVAGSNRGDQPACQRQQAQQPSSTAVRPEPDSLLQLLMDGERLVRSSRDASVLSNSMRREELTTTLSALGYYNDCGTRFSLHEILQAAIQLTEDMEEPTGESYRPCEEQ